MASTQVIVIVNDGEVNGEEQIYAYHLERSVVVRFNGELMGTDSELLVKGPPRLHLTGDIKAVEEVSSIGDLPDGITR